MVPSHRAPGPGARQAPNRRPESALTDTSHRRRRLAAASCLAAAGGLALCQPLSARAADAGPYGALFVSSSRYAGTAATIAVGQALPNSSGVKAVADGSYPGVFANDAVDPNFGVTAPIDVTALLTQVAAGGGVGVGARIGDLDVTALTGISTSFSSKSELALNLSTDGRSLTLMGYAAPINRIDISNTDTPAVIDPTNTDTQSPTNRAVVELDGIGRISATPVSAYSGNNGRAAVLVRDIQGSGEDAYLMVGNGGNGSGTEPASLVASTGVQLIVPGSGNPQTTVVGAPQGSPGAKNGYQFGFSVASLGLPADKSGKDDNFRGELVRDNQLYVSKGSGGNGVNSVYQVLPGADPLSTQAARISILPGFPTNLAANISASDPTTEFYPFGIWFANATTLYVADEGAQSLAGDPNAGLQKWIFSGSKWVLAYVLQNGLKLGQSYSVANYPQSLAPATTGLRNITGAVEGNRVTIFAATATFSAAADPGADPNQVVRIVDRLDATTLPTAERFATVQAPAYGKVYRGVAYVQCPDAGSCLSGFNVAGR